MRYSGSFSGCRIALPMCLAEQLGLARECRRGLFESRSEMRCVHLARSSSAAALPGQAAQGYLLIEEARHLGGLLLRTFSWPRKKSTWLPGHPRLRRAIKKLRLQKRRKDGAVNYKSPTLASPNPEGEIQVRLPMNVRHIPAERLDLTRGCRRRLCTCRRALAPKRCRLNPA